MAMEIDLKKIYHPVKIWIAKTQSDFKRWKFNLHEQLTMEYKITRDDVKTREAFIKCKP